MRNQTTSHPLLYALGKLDGGDLLAVFRLHNVIQLLAGLHCVVDRFVQLQHERALANHDFPAARRTVARQHVLHIQLHGGINHFRPITDVGVRSVVVRSIDNRVAGAQYFLFRQIHKAVASRVGPSKEAEFDASRAIGHYVWIIFEGLLRCFRMIHVHFPDVLALLGGGLPACGFVAL